MRNWYENVDTSNPLAVSSRIRLARNIKGIPFPKRMNQSQKEEVLQNIKNVRRMILLLSCVEKDW